MSPSSGSQAAEHWDDDGLLLRDLSGAVQGLPPAPPEFVAAAKAALTWRTIDAELAELSYDSADDLALSTRTRSGRGPRTLTFTSGDVTIELELSSAMIVGQVSPGGAGQVTAETTAGVFAETTTDEIGCFMLAGPPGDLFRLAARGERYAVVTGWMRLR
jgi:hypothetical protein